MKKPERIVKVIKNNNINVNCINPPNILSQLDKIKNSIVNISVFSVENTNITSSLSSGTGFIVQNNSWNIEKNKNGFYNKLNIFITTAHLMIPDFLKVNEHCYPFFISDTNSNLNYGVTTLNEWPYRYIADIYDDPTNTMYTHIHSTRNSGNRYYMDLELLGFDWDNDLAFLWCPYDIKTIPLPFSLSDPDIGKSVYALSDLWNIIPAVYSSGKICQSNYQPQTLNTSFFSTTICLNNGSSGCPILDDNTNRLVGMYFSKIESDTPYSICIKQSDILISMNKVINSIIYVDKNSTNSLCIIMGISKPGIAIDSILMDSSRIQLINVPPFSGGYLFNKAEPFSPLQNIIKKNDIIYAIEYNNITYSLGPYSGQYTLNQVLSLINYGDDITVYYLKWGVNGYTMDNSFSTNIKLLDDISNSWIWWYRWVLHPIGHRKLNLDLEIVNPPDFFIENLTRLEFQQVLNPGDPNLFKPLDTLSLRSPITLSNSNENSRIKSIWNEVRNYLLLHNSADIGYKGKNKILYYSSFDE